MKQFFAGMSAVLALIAVVAKVEAYPIGTTFAVTASVDNGGAEANAAFGSPDTGITATVELLPGMVWRYSYLVKAVEPGILQQLALSGFAPQAGGALTQIVIQTALGFLASDYIPESGPVGVLGTWTGVETIQGIRFDVSCLECNISFLSYNEPTWGGFMGSGFNEEGDTGLIATAMISFGMDASSISGLAPFGYIFVPGEHVDPPVVDPVPVSAPGVLALLIFGMILFPRRKG